MSGGGVEMEYPQRRGNSGEGGSGREGEGQRRGWAGAGLWGCVGRSRSCPHWLPLQLRGEREREREIIGGSSV